MKNSKISAKVIAGIMVGLMFFSVLATLIGVLLA